MDTRGVRAGMTVRDRAGQRLGRVGRVGERTFTIERNVLVKTKRVPARYELVARVDGGTVHLTQSGSQIEAEAYATPLDREPWQHA
jgi:hypothetical protein